MLKCPSCGNAYRVLTSRPISTDIREYCCHCKNCGVRFRQFAVFEDYVVENKNSRPPNESLQPEIARRRDKLLRLLFPETDVAEEPTEMGMVFKYAK